MVRGTLATSFYVSDNNMKEAAMTHTFSFFRVGGFNQVRLQSGADLLNLDQLDQKLWVALACPTQGLEFDRRTLEMIDSDKDGRIRANELIAAIKWAGNLLKDADELVRAPATLNLAAINDTGAEGQQVLQAARTVLQGLGKPGADSISVNETADALKAFNAMPFNGDGVLTVDSADSDAAKAVIVCCGVLLHPSGDLGGVHVRWLLCLVVRLSVE
jgi:hypothetical protein